MKARWGFYRADHPICRRCKVQEAKDHNLSLEEEAAVWKNEKIVRVELKALAMARFRQRKASKAEAKRKKLEPKPPSIENAVWVDPAARELAERELARRHLIDFILMFHPRYLAGWVHRDICRRLEKFMDDVAKGLSPRLMILMPPRHGKSQIASKLYPAWHLGHHPEHEFIGCSYGIDLAIDFSREIRDVISSDRYQTLFPHTKLDPQFHSASAWRLLSPTRVGAGGYNAAGVGGGITGKGAHVLVVDDPIKNDEEAESPDIRSKIWDWYRSTAYTRLAPGGGVLWIQTWWHDDDPAGRIQSTMLEDKEADQFEVIKYPAIAEEDEEYRVIGEALHPERYGLDQLKKIKKTLGLKYWSALYQQSPISEEGAYFSKNMFKYYDTHPPVRDLLIYQAWDLAISEKQHNDWTVGFTVGVDYEDKIYVLERKRFRSNDTALIINEMIDMYARYKTVSGFGVEDSQIWRTMRKPFEKRMKERRIYVPLDNKANIMKPIKEKHVRARPLQGRLPNQILWPRGKDWVDEVIREFLRFPSGIWDDQVDALAWVIILLIGRSAPSKPRNVWKKPEKTVAEKIKAFGIIKGPNSAMGA